MLGMAKKRTTDGKGDQHRSNHLVRLSPDVFEAMKSLADENDRPMTREVRQALVAWLKSKGRWPEQDEEEGGDGNAG